MGKKLKSKVAGAYAFAWALKSGKAWTLCYWSAPSRKQLISEGKPSPEAVVVRVRMEPAAASLRETKA